MEKEKIAHILLRLVTWQTFLKQRLQIDDQLQLLLFFVFLPVQSSKHTHQRIYPEQETTRQPFVVMKKEKKSRGRSTTSASRPGLFHNVDKRGDKNRVKSRLRSQQSRFKRRVLERLFLAGFYDTSIMKISSRVSKIILLTPHTGGAFGILRPDNRGAQCLSNIDSPASPSSFLFGQLIIFRPNP